MPLQATSGAASYDAFGGGVAAVPNYIEDVFSTYLYTGNGSTQTINNGIDLAGKGGLVWAKSRSSAAQHVLADTARGTGQILQTSTTNGNTATALNITSFNADGYGLSSYSGSNGSGITYASWTFRKQPKFFDVVTYTGDGSSNRPVAHSLASVPGCIIIKSTGTVTNWMVWHRSLPTDNLLTLNSTAAQANYATVTIHDVTSTNFQVDNYSMLNASGVQYVAYVYAHNAGGFGLTGTDNVISCGSVTTNGSGVGSVNLGWEPQWVLVKVTNTTNDWRIIDNMRGFTATYVANGSLALRPNTSGAESDASYFCNSTGFTFDAGVSQTFIYIAIRRGPMKVPTDPTKVFNNPYHAVPSTGWATATPNGRQYNGTSLVSGGNPIDLVITKASNQADDWSWTPRLTGFSSTTSISLSLSSNTTASESVKTGGIQGDASTASTGLQVRPVATAGFNTFAPYYLSRAPGFFDEVCYTGNSSNQTITHNLGAAPQLIIAKKRSGTGQWPVYAQPLGATKYLQLNTSSLETTGVIWNDTAPTSSVFSVGADGDSNLSGATYVAYLFASCPGVSKVGSYTGTGALQTIDCGFAAGSRFVLIKRTDSAGDWYVWDSARGIVAGNDPYLLLNSTAAEVTSTDYIDTYSAGFEISSTAPAAINASGGTFIFLAIA